MKKEIPWNLIIQKLKHDITAEEEHDLTVWLAEDNHRVIFEELQTLWQKVQENAINYTPDTNYYWKELSKLFVVFITIEQPKLIRNIRV